MIRLIRRLGMAALTLAVVATGLPLAQTPPDISGVEFSDPVTLTWDTELLADSYNAYRGDVSALSAGLTGQCHAIDLLTEALDVSITPETDNAFFYLITGESSVHGEGPLGPAGGGQPRLLLAPCSVALPARVMSRSGFGMDEWTEGRIAALGLTGYIDEQLDPASISEAGNTKLSDGLALYPDPIDFFELLARHVVQSVHSRRQLEQQMTMFWANHFNTYWSKVRDVMAEEWWPQCPNPVGFCDIFYPERAGIYGTRAIHEETEAYRDLAFNGNFRQMVENSARSVAMIYYLDLYLSDAAFPNENYARELMELSTMGVAGGQTQTDVEEVARALTGWSACKKITADVGNPLAPCILTSWWQDPPAGAWTAHFDPARHDCTEKTIFAATPQETILPDTCATPADGVNDMTLILDATVGHPSTAPFISKKILQLLVTDAPTQEMIDTLVAVWNDAGNPHGVGDIREVTRAALEIVATGDLAGLAIKLKTPYEHFMSALRALRGNSDGTSSLIGQSFPGQPGYLFRAQHLPFFNLVPTGYSEVGSDWIDTNSILERQNFGVHVALVGSTGFGTDMINLLNDNGVSTAPGNEEEIIDFLSLRMFGSILPPADRQRALDFLLTAADGTPDPIYDDFRIRSVAGVMLGFAQFQLQ